MCALGRRVSLTAGRSSRNRGDRVVGHFPSSLLRLRRPDAGASGPPARAVTYIRADYQVKNIFGKMVEAALIEQVPGTRTASTAYRKPQSPGGAYDMPATRRRRIVRRAVMALAGAVLLPACYVGSYVSLMYADSAGWVPAPFGEIIDTIYHPIGWYHDAGYPGSTVLERLIDATHGYDFSE